MTRPRNGGPPATFRVTALAADSPALAGAASPAAKTEIASATETLRIPFKTHSFRIRVAPSVVAP